MSNLASEDIHEKACAFYVEPENATIVKAASDATHEAILGHWPRIRELVFFAHEMGAHRIGIASCISFAHEAEMLAQILRGEGFEVFDALCRIGSLRRDEIGLDELPNLPNATTCNPYMQADVLNEAGCDFNIILGLCLGHDMLFTRRSNAWVTTLAIKDWSCAQNKPITAALERYQGIERLRQDLYDQAMVDALGSCGGQLAAANSIMGASEEQLVAMAAEAGLPLSRYGLE